MHRIACFAHYDQNYEIQDYVVYYLTELKKSGKNWLDISDEEAMEKDLEFIRNITI